MNLPYHQFLISMNQIQKMLLFELCEFEAALLDGETEEDRPRGVGTESCECECFVVIVDEEYVEEDEKHIKFLLTLVGKEITDFGNAKLSMPFFFSKQIFHIIRHTSTDKCINSRRSNRKPCNA